MQGRRHLDHTEEQKSATMMRMTVVSTVVSQNFTDWFSVGERCDTLDVLLEKGCARSYLEFPVSKAQVLQNRPLGKKSESDNSTQISPQKIALKLRPGTRAHLRFLPGLITRFQVQVRCCFCFSCRQSGDFPGEGSAHRALPRGPLLPDGLVCLHGGRSAEDQGLGVHSLQRNGQPHE